MRELTPFGIFPPAFGEIRSSSQQHESSQPPQVIRVASLGAVPSTPWLTYGLAILIGGFGLWMMSDERARSDAKRKFERWKDELDGQLDPEAGYYISLMKPGTSALVSYRGPFKSKLKAEQQAEKLEANWDTWVEWSGSPPVE